jgi:hypothetical protein
MRKQIEWQWEALDEFTKRAKVIGGWVIEYGSHTNKGSVSEALVFIPDRDHEWHIIAPIVEKPAPKNIASDFAAPK